MKNTNVNVNAAANVTMNKALKEDKAMKVFERTVYMTKKGVGSVELQQNISGYWIKANGIISRLADADALNQAYLAYRKAGWAVKDVHTTEDLREEKAASPKAEKKATPKKSREESLTEKYGSKEERRAYCQKRDEIRFQVAEEIRQWTKTHRRLSKEEYKAVWNKEVAKRLATLN